LVVVTRIAGSAAAFLLMLVGAPALADDYPLRGDHLRLSARPHPGMSRIRFGATGDLSGVRARAGADPRVTGAFLDVFGDGVLGADAPPVPLPAPSWRALGDPPGSRGYRYFDASCRFGVRKAALRFGTVTSLSVVGGGPAWPYRATGVPGTVTVRLSVVDEVYCATFETFQRRRRGALVARYNPPPVSCTNDAAGR
jgi:hypothetical protein